MLTNFPATSPAVNPRYIRLPKVGGFDPLTGLSRTAMDKLVRPQACNNFKPPVKSRVLAASKASRGIVLIDVKSLLSYLEGLPEGQPKRTKEEAAMA
jgi:hypothetical protein